MAGGIGGLGQSSSGIQTGAPQRKVIAATGGAAVGSAAAIILVWLLNLGATKIGLPLPDNIQSAFNTLFTTLSAFTFGYYTSPGANEVVVPGQNGIAAGIR